MAKNREIEIIARGVAVKDGQVLICQNRKKKNIFLPGGHIELDESAKTALARELLEETGLKVRVGRFLGACEHRFKYKGKVTCEVNLVFEFRLPASCPADRVPSTEEHLRFKWMALSALPKSKLEPWVLRNKLRAWLRARDASSRWASTY